MKIAEHPYLAGVRCRSDGAVFVPATKHSKGHWTYGRVTLRGYCVCWIGGRERKIHRLIAEAFHGLPPEGKTEVDHINRRKDDNRPENLRWIDRSGNMCNTRDHDRVSLRGSPHCYEDAVGYAHAWGLSHKEARRAAWQRYRLAHKDDPEFKEIREAANKHYQETHRRVIFANGIKRYVPNEEAEALLALPVSERFWAPKARKKERRKKTLRAILFSDHRKRYVPTEEADALLALPVGERIWTPKKEA